MNSSKEIKLFQIDFSDSDEEGSFNQSLKDKSLNVNPKKSLNIEQAHQQIQQTLNNLPSKDGIRHNLQRIHHQSQNQNNSIFQIDFDSQSQESPKPKYYSPLRKIKRLSENMRNQISSTNSPFIVQLNKNNHTKNQQILQKRKKLTNQKNKIQKFNQSFEIQGLEEIRLEAKLKRSDTSTTDQSLKDKKCMKQNILLDRFPLNNQKQNQRQLQNQSMKKNSQNNQIIEEQVQNHPPLFRQFRSFSFDSQLTQGSQIQQRYEGHSDEQCQSNKPFNHSEIQRPNYVRNLDKKDQQFDVLADIFSSEQYLKKRRTFLQKILDPLRTDSGIKQFLTTVIPQSQMFEFQVHVYKDLFKTQYQLWIKKDNTCDQSVLIANAQKNSFHIDKSTFIINRVNDKNQKEFIGQLESNFVRDFYSLHSYHFRNHIEDLRNIHQYEVKQIINMSFTVDRVAYLSKFTIDKQIQNVIKSQVEVINQKQKSHKNLKQKYQVEKLTHENKTFKLIPSKNIKFDKEFYKLLGIRDSKKTFLMQDGSNHNKLIFIGKIASKKYKLLAGQGLSPLQAFGIVIGHVEVN